MFMIIWIVATQPNILYLRGKPTEQAAINIEDFLAFAREFVEWNTIEHGIQRVDACRTKEGDLLLVELEDLNPYLSIDLLDAPTRDRFLTHFADALERAARA